MGWTKRQFIEAAYNELGYGGGFDIQPQRLEMALHTLDSMVAEWNADMPLGYPLATDQASSDVGQATNVPASANSAIYTSLAVRIAPSLGKVVLPQTQRAAKQGETRIRNMNTVSAARATNITMTPAGAGNCNWSGVTSLRDETS